MLRWHLPAPGATNSFRASPDPTFQKHPTDGTTGAGAEACGRLRRAFMARRSLRPHLNQIRGWVRQGRTDAWIAHQLEVTVQQVQTFKREQGLEEGEPEGANGVDFDDEIDLRAEDDALIAAELEA